MFAELIDVQLALLTVFQCHSQDLGLEPRPAARFAWHPRHERADPIPGELALRLLIKPLHLRHEAFERLDHLLVAAGWRFIGVAAEVHCDRFAVRAEVKRGFELVRQIGERHLLVDLKMLHERAL